MQSFWVSCQRHESWHGNLEFEMTKPCKESERSEEINSACIQHAFTDQLCPFAVPGFKKSK